MRRTLPHLVPQRLRALHDPPHLLERQQLIRRLRRMRLAPCPRLRSPLHLHQRLLLQLPPHVPALRQQPLRRVLACRCGLLQHREARLRVAALRLQVQVLLVLLAHRQPCNAIRRVPQRLVVRQGKRVQVRRRACARLAEHRNNIVRAARRRAVLAVRQGSVPVDRLRDSRNAPAAAVDRVAVTIKDQ